MVAIAFFHPETVLARGSKDDGLRCIAWIHSLSAAAPKRFLRGDYVTSRIGWIRLNTELGTVPLAEVDALSAKATPTSVSCDKANIDSASQLLPLERLVLNHPKDARVTLLGCTKALVISDFAANSTENRDLLDRLFLEGRRLGSVVSALDDSIISKEEFRKALTEKLSIREMSKEYLTSAEFQQLMSNCRFLSEPANNSDALPSEISNESKTRIAQAEKLKDKWVRCVAKGAQEYFSTGASALDSATAAQAKCNELYSKWAEFSEVVFMGLATTSSKEQAVLRAKATVTDVRTKVTNEVVKMLLEEQTKSRPKKRFEQSDSLL